MKKLLAAFLSCIFIFTAFTGLASASFESEPLTYVKSSIDVEICTAKTAVFTLSESGLNGKKLELRNESGKTLAVMHDNGIGGDKKANDGVYSVREMLYSEQRGLQTYGVYADGVLVKEYEINFYKNYTDAEFAQLDDINRCVNTHEAELLSKSISDDKLLSEMQSYISSLPGVESAVIDNGTVSYVTEGGIPCVYAHFDENTRGTGNADGGNALIYTADGEVTSPESVGAKGNETLQSWTNPNVLLVRPFRNVAGEDGFHNENYVNAANNIIKYSGGYITILDDEETCPGKLRDNFWRNGFIMVDSHGLTNGDNSYMVVWDGDGYGNADLSAGRVLKTNTPNHVLVTGIYFEYYYEQDNFRMENTFLYFGICFGMLYPKLRNAFFRLGAVCAYGYDNSVTMGYEAANLKVMYPYMAKLCAEDETRTYNLEEAAAEAIRKNGAIDPYSDLGTKLITDGDTQFVFYKPDVALTDMDFALTSIDNAIQNTYCYIPVKLSPEGQAYGYTQEWTSSNPDVVEIKGHRVGFCKAPGTAVIKAVFTYDGRTWEDSCTVTVTEILPEKIEVQISAINARFKVGQSRELYTTVRPTNASEQELAFVSNNTGVVTVDEKGILTSHRPGKSIITIYVKAYPDVRTDYEVEVVTDEVYRAGAELNTAYKYLIVSKESSPNMLMAQESATAGYVQHRSVSKHLGHYTGNINATCFWEFIPADNVSYYLYNSAQNVYLTRGEGGAALLTSEPRTKLVFNGTNIFVWNTEDDDVNTYLKAVPKSGGFCFREQSGSSVKFDLGRVMTYTDKTQFSKVIFEADGKQAATQYVEMHDKAVPATVQVKGKTFLGWDACLADITADTVARAVFEDGENSNIILTFKDYDGSLIERVEFAPGESFTAPDAPAHEGLSFKGWSEDIEKPTQNMIVFAMYEAEGGLTGDVNEDGKVNTGDATLILKYAAEMTTLTDSQLHNGDTNHDGKVNTGDATMILKYAAGMISEF